MFRKYKQKKMVLKKKWPRDGGDSNTVLKCGKKATNIKNKMGKTK